MTNFCLAKAVASAMRNFVWDPEDDLQPFDLVRYHESEAEPTMNTVLSKLTFSDNVPNEFSTIPSLRLPPHLRAACAVYLRRPYKVESVHPRASIRRRRIENHPLVWRSMATFPFATEVSFSIDGPFHNVHRAPAITVSDMVSAISSW